MKTLTLLGTAPALSFTSGLNLCATVLLTGLAVRMGRVRLPPGLEGLPAIAHPVAALVIVLVGLGLLAIVAPLGWRLLKSRLAALGYLLRHKLVDRRLPGLDTSHLPESVVHAFADNGVRPGEEGLILPASVRSLPGIPRWAPGFVALVPGGAVFACRAWLRTRVARVSWTDGRPVLLPRVTGCLLQARTPKGRATFTFFPLTAPMGEALERTVAREAGGPPRPGRAESSVDRSSTLELTALT